MEQMFNTEINVNLKQEEFEALLQEFKTDYNQTHFVRNPEFKKAAEEIQGPMRKIFVEFLERSCTAEFSGFLLYKELGRRLKVFFQALCILFESLHLYMHDMLPPDSSTCPCMYVCMYVLMRRFYLTIFHAAL
jgi:hypothetical protein